MPNKILQDDTPYEEMLFAGKLVTSREPFLVGKENYTELRNMRYSPEGVGIETRYGMRRFNNTAIASGGDIEKLWQHLYTYEQTRYHDLYVVTDEKALYKCDSLPESSAGAGSLGNSLYSFSANSNIPAFCSVENHAVATSGQDLIAYSGATPNIVQFLYGTDIGTADTAADEDDKTFQIATDEVTDANTNRTVTITLDTQANNEALYVGYWQPVDGIKWDLTAYNATSATITVSYWNGSAWTAISTGWSDGTASGGAPFAQDGTMSWTYIAVGTEKPHRINGQTLFWYRIETDTTLDNFTVNQITVTKDWREIEDLGDGREVLPSGCIWLDDGDDPYHDVLDRVIVDSKGLYVSFKDDTADEDIAAADEIYLGFPVRVLGIRLDFVERYANDGSASTLTVSYWGGTSWTAYAADEINDGTSKNSKTFNQSGEIRLEDKGVTVKPTTLPNAGIKLPMFWYKLTFSAKMYNDTNDEMRMWKVRGLPAPRTQDEIRKYNWVENFKDRLFLFGPEEAPNTIDFSAYKNPFALTGSDTSSVWPRITLGNQDEIVCGVRFFNELFGFKRNEVWLIEGDSPDTFGTLLLDDTIGCVAPETAKVVRTWVSLPDGRRDFRHACFFLAHDGVYAADAVKIWKLSDDIENYFNPKYTDTVIKSNYRQLSSAWFDPNENEYHLLIWSGSTPTLLEFVYNTVLERWTGPFVRLTDIECGATVYDGNNERLQYGGGTDGRVYRLEIGSNDVYTNGTVGAIDNWAETGDMWTGLRFKQAHRNIFLFGKAQSAGSVTVSIKGDGQTTGATVGTANMVRAGYETFISEVAIGDRDTNAASMENKFHAHRLKFATNTAGVRQELYGLLTKKAPVGAPIA